MCTNCNSILFRQSDGRQHTICVPGMESACNICRGDIWHDVFIIADVFTHVTVEVDIHMRSLYRWLSCPESFSTVCAQPRDDEQNFIHFPQYSSTHSSTLDISSVL